MINMARKSEFDESAATELKLYCDNDGELYNRTFKPIQAQMVKKLRAGRYLSAKAPAGWMYLVEACAKKYAKEFASPSDWSTMFSKSTRVAVAREYTQEFEQQYAAGDLRGSHAKAFARARRRVKLCKRGRRSRLVGPGQSCPRGYRAA